MTETLHLTIEGKPYLVETDDLTACPLIVRVNGKPFTIKIESDEPASATGHSETDQAGAPPAGDIGAKEIKAPMPGIILDIAVKPGDRVTHKQLLCNLEAMKMKNGIRSPREGTIAAVHIHEGQAAAYGDLLFTFE